MKATAPAAIRNATNTVGAMVNLQSLTDTEIQDISDYITKSLTCTAPAKWMTMANGTSMCM